jgi:hypothetical protein
MGKTISLTSVNLSGKGLVWMGIAMTAVLVVYGAATFGAGKVREALKGMTKGVAEKTDEAF